MSYWRKISPSGAIGDLFAYWRQPTPYRWPILGLSMAITLTMLLVLIPETVRKPPDPPEVTWISTFEAGRTDAQIAASNLANQQRQDVLTAERAQREEERRERARALGRATFIDVDSLEAQMKRRLAAQEAAQAAARARAAEQQQQQTQPAR
ncbi:MAG: hypothetical protein B7Z33_00135 [Sphingomonadales bacterium 12-68-11]|nr:MAG: hypothetical protein B7Z33_00135 [Sphingomonadales bacterium 12-68-11]